MASTSSASERSRRWQSLHQDSQRVATHDPGDIGVAEAFVQERIRHLHHTGRVERHCRRAVEIRARSARYTGVKAWLLPFPGASMGGIVAEGSWFMASAGEDAAGAWRTQKIDAPPRRAWFVAAMLPWGAPPDGSQKPLDPHSLGCEHAVLRRAVASGSHPGFPGRQRRLVEPAGSTPSSQGIRWMCSARSRWAAEGGDELCSVLRRRDGVASAAGASHRRPTRRTTPSCRWSVPPGS